MNHTTDQRLDGTRREMKSPDRLLQNVSEALAHLVRNAVASVTTNAELLQDSLDETDIRQVNVDAILKETRRIGDLIRGVVDCAAPMEIKNDRVDLASVVGELDQDFKKAAHDAGVVLRFSIGEGVGSLRGDRKRLLEALSRIVENSIAVTPVEGQVCLVVSRMDEEEIRVRIEDSGPGFGSRPPERLFDPLFSGSSQKSGLGLSVAKKIIELHRGRISAGCSNLGGACFDVRFPLMDTDE